MGKMRLFGSMAMGQVIKIVDSRTGLYAIGNVVEIKMESGPSADTTPNRWLVKVITLNDDVIDLFVITID